MNECIYFLGDARVLSNRDCNAGYGKIPVAEEDKHLTAFTCHSGAWQCVRLRFGLCSAPATFQRAMDMILAGVKWQICLVYLDDVIVFSCSLEEHLQHLDEVLTRMGKAGVTLKAAKCHFFQDEVEYRGHVIKPGRVNVLEKNLRAQRGLRYQETQNQMKIFLGMCGVKRRFVADFAKIAKPLTAWTSTKLPKRLPLFREEESKAFVELRGRLLAAPILVLPRREGHYIIDVDASYEQLGRCLQQQQPDGEYHPVGYYSRALPPAEKNYFATEIEALGVVWAVTFLRSYLEGAEFLVRCDHRALLSVLTNMSPNARINRWRLRLSEYTYEIRHKPGKDEKVADALSRLPTEGLDSAPLDEDIPVLAVETRASDALGATSPAEEPLGALTAHKIILGQAEDAFCKKQLKELDVLSPPDPKWSRQTFFFRERNGLLCRHSVYGRETQVVLPEALKQRLLLYQHQSVLAGHAGSRKMYDTLHRYVYWPTIVVDVYKHVDQCPACAKNRLSERRHASTMKLFPALERFSGPAMDLLGPLTTSRGGHKHELVIRDRFTKVTRAIPLLDATALTVSSAFMDACVAAYGIPDSVLTDNGPQFASFYYQGILGLLGIASNYTSPYDPQTNGQVERYHRTLVRQLRCYIAEHQKEWDRHLFLLTTAYNRQVHASTGEIPFAFVSPRRLQLIGMERMPRRRQAEERTQDAFTAAEQYVDDLRALIPAVRRPLGKAQATYKWAFDARTKEKNNAVKAEDWVYLDAHSLSPKKLGLMTRGPYMVLQTDEHRFLVESPKGLRTVSSDHVPGAPAPPARDGKWTRAPRAQALCKVGDQINKGAEFVFGRFLNHGWDDDGQLKVLVKWFGFPDPEATWHFASSLPREAIRKYRLRKRVKLPALRREGVFISGQVGRRPLGAPVTSSHREREGHKKRGRTFYSLRGPRPVYRRIDGAHPLRGGDNVRHTMQRGDTRNPWSPQGDQVTNP